MILKSAPSESIAENVLYEIGQALRQHDQFTSEQIAAALAFERTMLLALETDSNWNAAGEALDAANKQSWFPAMRIPAGMAAPPPPPMLAALRALIYDPTGSPSFHTIAFFEKQEKFRPMRKCFFLNTTITEQLGVNRDFRAVHVQHTRFANLRISHGRSNPGWPHLHWKCRLTSFP